jgi:hypothetical protein
VCPERNSKSFLPEFDWANTGRDFVMLDTAVGIRLTESFPLHGHGHYKLFYTQAECGEGQRDAVCCVLFMAARPGVGKGGPFLIEVRCLDNGPANRPA